MAKSLQEQLLKAGLVDAKKVKKVRTEQQKQAKKNRKSGAPAQIDEQKQQLQKARAEKIERDRQLNREREDAAARKALNVQIRQMIRENQLPQDPDGIPYSFQDDGKIRRIYVSDAMKNAIVAGQNGIVRHGRVYAVVPAETALRIRDKDASRAVVIYENKAEGDSSKDDDPYAEYQIPDDLVW